MNVTMADEDEKDVEQPCDVELRIEVDVDWAAGLLARELQERIPWDWYAYRVHVRRDRMAIIITESSEDDPLTTQKHRGDDLHNACVALSDHVRSGDASGDSIAKFEHRVMEAAVTKELGKGFFAEIDACYG